MIKVAVVIVWVVIRVISSKGGSSRYGNLRPVIDTVCLVLLFRQFK